MSAVSASHLHHGGAFDPAAWLAAFEAAGGWYVIQGDVITLGHSLAPLPLADRETARRMMQEIRNKPERYEQVHEEAERRWQGE